MTKFFVIGGCILLHLAYIPLFSADEYCAPCCDAPYCIPPPPVNPGDLYCRPLVDMFYAFKGACTYVFGQALNLTDLGNQVAEENNDPSNVCDYFDNSSVVQDCLHPNGTIELYSCTHFFTLLIMLKDTCKEYYTVDLGSLTPIATQQYNYSVDPCESCRPAYGPQNCQLVPLPFKPPRSPKCVSASSTFSSSIMLSSMPVCN